MKPISRSSLFMLLALLVAVILGSFSVVPERTARAETGTCTPSHIVQPGENLFRIGLKYGVSWVVLQKLNNISNPNQILIGQVICLPGSVPPAPIVTPLPPAPTLAPGVVYFPPSGVFPRISFNTYRAKAGDTLTITGIQFPGNSLVEIYITPTGQKYPSVSQGTATTAADGTLNTTFVIPAAIGEVPLTGARLSIAVVARPSGYYGYNFFYNTGR